jgi:putative endonuclease
MPREWFVYVIECDPTGSLYTGRTTDPARRFREHASGRGAKYTRSHPPRRMVWVEGGHDASSSGKREAQIKKLTREQKLALVHCESNKI